MSNYWLTFPCSSSWDKREKNHHWATRLAAEIWNTLPTYSSKITSSQFMSSLLKKNQHTTKFLVNYVCVHFINVGIVKFVQLVTLSHEAAHSCRWALNANCWLVDNHFENEHSGYRGYVLLLLHFDAPSFTMHPSADVVALDAHLFCHELLSRLTIDEECYSGLGAASTCYALMVRW
jgi:hypothetical protein